jgi:hypothetical protein
MTLYLLKTRKCSFAVLFRSGTASRDLVAVDVEIM